MKNLHSPFRVAILMIALSAALTTACYVPASVHARFPEGVESILPPRLELDDERLLAIPLWLQPGQNLLFGAPVVLEANELAHLRERTNSFLKRGMVDVFGHEGLGVPIFLGVFLISETGEALRARYDQWFYVGPKGKERLASGWTEVRLARVTEELRAHLVNATQVEVFEEPWGSLAYEFWQRLATKEFLEARYETPPPLAVDVPWMRRQRAEAKTFLESMAIHEASDGELWELVMDLNAERHGPEARSGPTGKAE